MHVLPELRKLEHKYRQELVIVGVHSGKFLAERLTPNIRQAVLRLEIEHPVVNDRYFRTWRSYGVSAWPTMALVSPDGEYIGSHAGEIAFESFDPVIGQLVSQYDGTGRLDRSPLAFKLEREAEPERSLAFPGKVLATTDGHLFIADTNHNRILMTALNPTGEEATIQEIIGEGRVGMQDGGLSSATFNHPQGMAIDGRILYVADTGNHAIRAIDLVGRRVETIAGTGEQARRRLAGIGAAYQTALNSPWDVAYHRGTLYIAMAGSHQLWSMDLVSRRITLFAGSGLEDLTDGSLSSAALAQSTGITLEGQRLYFVDSESSSVRWADLTAPEQVHTITGTGLFDFGDREGAGDNALLQHPMGIVFHEGKLYVADTYNNKIKIIDPDTRQVDTYFGTGEEGSQDGEQSQFDEPEGVSAAKGKLYVADTNNHLIRVADLATRKISTLRLIGI